MYAIRSYYGRARLSIVLLVGNDIAIEPGQIGLWGISQAGYVMPRVLLQSKDIAFMIAVSCPGMAGVDQGMYLGAIGDKVWNDYDADGIQDAGEPGISGVTVRLIDESTMLRAKDINGNDIADTTTNTNGNYNFNNLGVGKYIVEFTKPAGYDKSSPSFVGAIV